MTHSWEEYLFKEHNALAVSPSMGKNGLQLFQLIIKDHRHTVLGYTVKLSSIGNLFEYALREKMDAQSLQALDHLQEALDKFNPNLNSSQPGDQGKPIITCEPLGSMTGTVKTGSAIFGEVADAVKLDIASTNVVTCTLNDVTLHSVNEDALRKAVNGWKPDMANIYRHTSSKSLELWVITNILYANQLTTGEAKSKSIDGSLQSGVLGLAAAVPPCTGGEVGGRIASESSRNYTGGNTPFAIRTTLLRCNSAGELLLIERNAMRRPGRLRSLLPAPPQKFLDPVRDPHYNMDGLFQSNNPDDEDAFVPLTIDFTVKKPAASAVQSEVDHGVSDANTKT